MNTKNDKAYYRAFFFQAIILLFFLLLCRIIANYFIPLNDATEARYGEIARKMLETGNWINLLHDYNIPFWAKPPLSTWLSAISMNLFGINEFAARLPGLLLSIAILWLISNLAKKHSGSLVALLSSLVLAGTLFFFLDAGTVMTDPALLFCITLSLIAFWHALAYDNTLWSYLFFVGLGLGLLAKGPIAVILIGLPIFFWVLLTNQWSNVWQRLPWIKGTILVLVIALPWYVLAEMRTPGFLRYFIIGEHFSRFLIPGWTGDKYGMAHHAAKGMIWFYALIGLFPWSFLGGYGLFKDRKKIPALFRDEDGWILYLFLCTIMPLIFFTFASNIIYPYVFPSLPTFALLFSELWWRSNQSLKKSQWIIGFAAVSGASFLIITFVFIIKPSVIAKTQKPMITAWLKHASKQQNDLVYWSNKTDFSAQFYAAGKVKSTLDISYLCTLFSQKKDNYLVINAKLVAQFPSNLLVQCMVVKIISEREDQQILMHCPIFKC